MRDGSYVLFDYDKAFKLLEEIKKTSEKWTGIEQIPIGYDAEKKQVVIAHTDTVSYDIANFICSKDKAFAELYEQSKPSDKLSYSECSIMATKIPTIVLMAYSEGLQKAMNKGHIKYRFSEKRTGISHSAMYFAVQGLFSGVASGIGGTAILTLLKATSLWEHKSTFYITVVAAIAALIAFGLAFLLPKSISELGKEKKEEPVETVEPELVEGNDSPEQ